jgi:hypothetical protein
MSENLKVVAVIAVQPVFGGKPEKTVVVLGYGGYKALRQSLFD